MTFAVRLCGFGILMLLVGCIHTKAGTHVELVEQDGVNVYVSGAAGPGISRTIACRNAIQRAAAAIGHRFAQEHDGIGGSDGEGRPSLHQFIRVLRDSRRGLRQNPCGDFRAAMDARRR